GWAVLGQDLDPKAGRAALDRGLEVHHGPVAELVGREEPFDLIGLGHVIEHAVDPAELLEACAALLAPGGRLCVVCPNASSLARRLFGRRWYGLDQPRHLAVPTLESLDRLTAPLGLEALHARTTAANAAVLVGGTLDHVVEGRLRSEVARRLARPVDHLLGQALGRVASRVGRRLGEEIVWIGRPAGR
ncbi:MAG TPA: methyltransferase domain-containing protein, partial [Acidimicrobiales bacterium]|nr:methyltransferase domain-containing protein [Acidimicrobiales bacterium]